MRIRRSAASSVSPSHTHQSPSSCSSSSSCFSSSHSTISTHSLSSSSNSTSSSSSPSLSSSRRCEGLDLLVKAVYFVGGSIVGVPYIQKRVIRRRKPALRFGNLVINSVHKLQVDDIDVDVDDDEVLDCCNNLIEQKQKMMIKKKKTTTNNKQKKRSKAIPVKYQDSVLQSWKLSDRRRRRSIKA
ncbi:Keratin type I cytoskeletal 40 [Bienertia sinuspersici]